MNRRFQPARFLALLFSKLALAIAASMGDFIPENSAIVCIECLHEEVTGRAWTTTSVMTYIVAPRDEVTSIVSRYKFLFLVSVLGVGMC
jgi:hypothetical protein